MKKMGKRILMLVLALVLAAACPLTVAADVWIPPDNNVNYILMESPYNDGVCRTLNAFVSNYVEANLKEFDEDSPDSTAIAATLKHLELNEGLFGSDVTKINGEDGKTYMKVSASIFEERARKLFGRRISASSCPGYEDGFIYVSAANFGGPIRVFGSVSFCNYIGNGVYDLQFTVYYVSRGVTDEYDVPFYEVSDRGYQELGTGYAVFYFNDPDKTSFRTSDLQLLSLTMDAEGIPCGDANLPMPRADQSSGATETPPEESQPVQTEPEQTEPEQTEPEPTESESTKPEPTEKETEPESTKAPEQDRDTDRSQHRGGGAGSRVVLGIVLAVLAVALLALAVILLVYRKK